MSSAIAIVTGSTIPHPDLDELSLLAALQERSHEARSVSWDDPDVGWNDYACAVVRSTWNYENDQKGFVAWAHRAAASTRLANPAPVLEWNTDKRYLTRLEQSGVPVVPTSYTEPGHSWSIPETTEFVVKPAIGGGARSVARFTRDSDKDAARESVERIHSSGRAVLTQPYLRRIDDEGEKVLIFLGGAFSHAVLRGPILGPHGTYTDITIGWKEVEPIEVDDHELEIAQRALAATPGGAEQLLYARVDLIRTANGTPCVLEVELTEPCLFLAHHAAAVDRFADLITHLAQVG